MLARLKVLMSCWCYCISFNSAHYNHTVILSFTNTDHIQVVLKRNTHCAKVQSVNKGYVFTVVKQSGK